MATNVRDHSPGKTIRAFGLESKHQRKLDTPPTRSLRCAAFIRAVTGKRDSSSAHASAGSGVVAGAEAGSGAGSEAGKKRKKEKEEK